MTSNQLLPTSTSFINIGFFSSLGSLAALGLVYMGHNILVWGWKSLFSPSCPVGMGSRHDIPMDTLHCQETKTSSSNDSSNDSSDDC